MGRQAERDRSETEIDGHRREQGGWKAGRDAGFREGVLVFLVRLHYLIRDSLHQKKYTFVRLTSDIR